MHRDHQAGLDGADHLGSLDPIQHFAAPANGQHQHVHATEQNAFRSGGGHRRTPHVGHPQAGLLPDPHHPLTKAPPSHVVMGDCKTLNLPIIVQPIGARGVEEEATGHGSTLVRKAAAGQNQIHGKARFRQACGTGNGLKGVN